MRYLRSAGSACSAGLPYYYSANNSFDLSLTIELIAS